jgi:DNA modification methylase
LENAHEDGFDGDAEAEKIAEPVTRTGDIWYLGKHRLLCGDCTKADEAARLMAGRLADLMVTDPPYNVNYKDAVDYRKNGGRKSGRAVSDIVNDDMSDKDFYEFLFGFYKAAYGAMRGGAPLYVFHSTKESVNFVTALKAAGFKAAQTLTWVKNHFTLGRQDYQWITEPILYGWKEAEGGHYFVDDRTLSTVFEDAPKDVGKMGKEEMKALLARIYALPTDAVRADKPVKSELHPTMKPIVLCAKLIFNSSREGDLVYEPFNGSGSTLIACGQLNRFCYAVEIDARYVDAAVKRFVHEFPNEEIRLIRGGKEVSREVWAALAE